MIMTNKEKDTIALLGSCGISEGVVLQVDSCGNDIDGYDISLVSDTYYLDHYTEKNRFREKLKRIWKILRNQEYYYFDIYVSAEDIKEFKKFVAQI